ncbi:MAG: hypothetical protein IJ934_07670 [Acetobacter sp.]|nr:hypothetical protein [Acetobacter sp.]
MADDTKAKVAAGVGAVGITAAITAAVSGSSAAAMTSTLATVGLGSMAAGIGVVAAAPVAIAGLAYGVTRLFTDD